MVTLKEAGCEFGQTRSRSNGNDGGFGGSDVNDAYKPGVSIHFF